MHSANAGTNCRLNVGAYSLIELMLGLSLLASMALFSIPLISSLYQNNQIQVLQDDIKSAVHYAKSMAMVSGKNAILKPLGNLHDWSQGMVLLVDNQPVHTWQWSLGDNKILWRGFQSTDFLLFSADAGRNSANGYFLVMKNKQPVIKLMINRLGRVRVDVINKSAQ